MQRELCKIEENRGKLTNCWYICHQMKNDRWPNTPPSPSPPLYTLLKQFTNVHLFLAKLLKWKVWKMSLKLAIFHLILWFRVDCGVLELHTQTHINIHQHTQAHIQQLKYTHFLFFWHEFSIQRSMLGRQNTLTKENGEKEHLVKLQFFMIGKRAENCVTKSRSSSEFHKYHCKINSH